MVISLKSPIFLFSPGVTIARSGSNRDKRCLYSIKLHRHTVHDAYKTHTYVYTRVDKKRRRRWNPRVQTRNEMAFPKKKNRQSFSILRCKI